MRVLLLCSKKRKVLSIILKFYNLSPGKGLAALTFDEDYQRKRREQMNYRPTNVQEGIAQSGKGLVMASEI